MTDCNGRETAYEYDDAGRRTAEKWLDGMGSPIHTISYVYDDAGQLTSVSDADSSYAFTYTDSGDVETVDNDGTTGVGRKRGRSSFRSIFVRLESRHGTPSASLSSG